MKKRIFSGIQPTGELHFGNYFGAVQNWVRLQNDYDCTFMVVDYHAITMPYDVEALTTNTKKMALDLIALGVKPENLCIQSLIPEHTELCWILNNFCSFGELQRMTQFKDKSNRDDFSFYQNEQNNFISVGLFVYPVLQAADIILHAAELVPVGKDQEQHLELARNIAERFNQRTNTNTCLPPKPLFTEIPKVMSLADPTKKMSKSLGEKHYVGVFEDTKTLTKKVKTAITDTGEDVQAPMSAGVANLFGLLRAAGHEEQHKQFLEAYNNGSRRYGDLKNAVITSFLELTTAFKNKRDEISGNEKKYLEQLRESSFLKRKKCTAVLKKIKKACGFNIPKWPMIKN